MVSLAWLNGGRSVPPHDGGGTASSAERTSSTHFRREREANELAGQRQPVGRSSRCQETEVSGRADPRRWRTSSPEPRRAAHHDESGAQAAGPHPAGRAVRGRAVHRDRDAGALRSNRQTWQFVLVDDPAVKQQVADLYGSVFDSFSSSTPAAKLRRDRHPGAAQGARQRVGAAPAGPPARGPGDAPRLPARPSDQLPAGSQPGWWARSSPPCGASCWPCGPVGSAPCGRPWCPQGGRGGRGPRRRHGPTVPHRAVPGGLHHRHRLQAGPAGGSAGVVHWNHW